LWRSRLADAKLFRPYYAPMLRRRRLPLNMRFLVIQEFEKRISNTIERYPYLVAEEDGQVLGYAYASTYYARTAYDWTTELSIYLNEDARGRGLGSQLYGALEEGT
ncbi:Phosphinothricin acetyltransferase, partial [Streptococcus thermophilus CNCM I-1630]